MTNANTNILIWYYLNNLADWAPELVSLFFSLSVSLSLFFFSHSSWYVFCVLCVFSVSVCLLCVVFLCPLLSLVDHDLSLWGALLGLALSASSGWRVWSLNVYYGGGNPELWTSRGYFLFRTLLFFMKNLAGSGVAN